MGDRDRHLVVRVRLAALAAGSGGAVGGVAVAGIGRSTALAYSPLPRRAGDRLFYAGESVPPAYGVAPSERHLQTREAR